MWVKRIGGSILAFAAGWIGIADAIEKSPVIFSALRFQENVTEIEAVKNDVKSQRDQFTVILRDANSLADKMGIVEKKTLEQAAEVSHKLGEITTDAENASRMAEGARKHG